MAFRVSCHCGHIQLEVDEAEIGIVYECNCSICTRSGFLHWYVEPEKVRYLNQGHGVSTYVWRTLSGGQHFCPNCGTAVYRSSTQYPPPLSINARCIEGVNVATLTIQQLDGRSYD